MVSAVESPPVDVNRRGRSFVVEPSRPQLRELGARVVAGELRPVVGAAWWRSGRHSVRICGMAIYGASFVRVDSDAPGHFAPTCRLVRERNEIELSTMRIDDVPTIGARAKKPHILRAAEVLPAPRADPAAPCADRAKRALWHHGCKDAKA